MFRKRLLIPFMVILALFLTACGTDNTNNKQDPADNQNAADNEVVDNANNQQDTGDNQDAMNNEVTDNANPGVVDDDFANFRITPEGAFDIFMEKHPDATVDKMQVEKSMGNFLYKVEGYDEMREYETEIHPLTGEITKDDNEADNDMDGMELTRPLIEKVTAIVDKAIADAGEGALLHEWTLEMDDGIAELEVEIDKKGLGQVEYTYNAETGKLIDMDD